MTDHSLLFQPTSMGEIVVPNRVFMAPLTRNRSQADGTPNKWAEVYYRQRASAGLILSEATQISAMGKGYLDTPGIYTQEHVKAWQGINDAVHAAGGRIFCQLWHVGRISHSSLLPNEAAPHAPSAVRAQAQTFTANGFEDTSEPVAMSTDQIKQTMQDYVTAAKCAKEAGFDGIEVHAANGYLIDQFLQDGTNKRDDEYGGSRENRMRFLREVLEAVLTVWPKGRVGARLSPMGQANDIEDSASVDLFTGIYKMLSGYDLAYLHVLEEFPGSTTDEDGMATMESLRKHYDGFYMGNGGYGADSIASAIAKGHADAVSGGRHFIANPDLPERYRQGAELNKPDQDTFYGGDETGYIDYPFLDPQSNR